jgi:PKD repeat protein/N-acetylneuraminic acid mutarotase
VVGASVTIESAYGNLDVTTAAGGASSKPYYSASLSAAPLAVSPGDVLTITASYSGMVSIRTWTVQSGGQHVDVGMVEGYLAAGPLAAWAGGSSSLMAHAPAARAVAPRGAPFSQTSAVITSTWVELFPVGSPPYPVWLPKQVNYDAANNRLIVFFPGNPPYNGDPPGNSNEVWILTNANGLGGTPTWIKLEPTGTAPHSNGWESAVYDVATNRLVVYGGCYANCSPALSDVFMLTHANGLGGTPEWSQLSVTNPQARAQQSAIYDPVSNLMVTFGGHLAFYGTYQNDTRVLSNANGMASPSTWSTLSTSGHTPVSRGVHTAVYDHASNRMIVFGGEEALSANNKREYDDLWILTNANGIGGTPTWIQQMPVGNRPSARAYPSAVLDPAHNRMILFGGGYYDEETQSEIGLGDLWVLDSANGLNGPPSWTELSQIGDMPGPRFCHTAALDEVHQRMIVLGGVDQSGATSNQVWVLILQEPVPTLQFSAPTYSVSESAGPATVTVTLSATSVETVTVQYTTSDISAQATASMTWASKTSMPTRRFSPGVVATSSGKVYVIGGWDGPTGQVLATVEEYDPAADTWTTRASMPTAREGLSVVAANNGKIYAIGGDNETVDRLATVEEYDPATDTWTTRTSMPTARTALGAAAGGNGKIYAIGGAGLTILNLATVEEYDPATDTWTTRASMPTARHALGVVTASNGKIYAIGGTNTGNGSSLATVEEYDPSTDTWVSRADMPTARQSAGVAAGINGRVYVIGGWKYWSEFVNTVEEYDPATDTWDTQPSMPTARYGLGATTASNGKIYAIGGRIYMAPQEVNAVEEATIVSDYTSTGGTLAFAPGDTSRTFAVPIINDTLDETNETVTLTLSNPTNADLGAPSTATLTIVDDDEPTSTPTPTPTETPVPPTNTPVPPTNTPVPPTNTPLPPTSTPVPPTNTPLPPTNTPLPPTNTPVPPTNTPIPPTNTPVPPTDTPIPPTNTPVPPTNTPVPPTSTPVLPTNTPVPPTNTPVPPTNTSVPLTNTPVPPTNTPVPPTATPTPTPHAEFTASPLSGTAPLTVTFTDQSSGDVVAWTWDFGDNSISGARHPAHVYTDPGDYTVTLTVAGPGGADTETRPNYVHVSAVPGVPVASISYIWYDSYPDPAVQGQDTLYFNGNGYDTDEGGAYITAYVWDSSIDGPLSVQEDFTVQASELATGTHTITFKVRDDEGVWSPEVTRTLTIQANPQQDVRTLILVNRQQLVTLYSESEAAQVMSKLNALAAHTAVEGLVVQVEDDSAVAAAYAAWNADLTSTTKANAVTAAIRNLVLARWTANPNLEYLVIAGDDRAIPFRRVLDQTRYPERNYRDSVSCTSVTGAALCADMTLTDDYYADRVPTIPDSPGWDGHALYIPDLGAGRLIESPAEIGTQIDAFLANSSVSAGNAIVTGYDFLSDGAQAVCSVLSGDGLSTNCSLIGASWTAGQFKSQVLNTRHDFVSINGHATHGMMGAPSGVVYATDVINATASHIQALFYTPGCHAGLNVPPNNPTQPLDLAQAFIQRRANYVANTGYGWGYVTSVGLSEQLMLDFSERLTYGSSATAGQALAAAKQEYYLNDRNWDYYDEKILIESTLYGLPMVRYVNQSQGAGLAASAQSQESAVIRVQHTTALGNGLTVNSYSYQFPALTAESTENGLYYTLSDLVDTGHGEPIQPRYVADTSFPQTEAHGVVFRGGVYTDVAAFNPVVNSAFTETATLAEPAFSAPGWYPAIPYRLNSLERGDRLVTTLGQFNAQSQTERIYDRLSFDVYYHTSSDDWTPPEITSMSSGVTGGNTLITVGAEDDSDIEAVVIAYTDGNGVWSSASLTLNSGKWSGSFPASGSTVFFVQAVDQAGNVAVNDNGGQYFRAGDDLYEIYLPLVVRNH